MTPEQIRNQCEDDADHTPSDTTLWRDRGQIIAAQQTRIAQLEAKAIANLDAIEWVYRMQCPVGSTSDCMDEGAYYAHLWWQTVLGGELDRLRKALS